MRIGMNLLFLIPGEVGGTESYTTSLIKALSKIDKVNEYFLLVNRESESLTFADCPNFQQVVCPIRAERRAVRFLWEQFVLPWQARRLRLDVMHSLGYISPLLLPCPSVVTIHDLNFLYAPDIFTPMTRRIQQFFVTSSAKRANRIIVVSQFIREQLVAYLDETKDKVDVVHEAPKVRALPRADGLLWHQIKQKYSLHRPYMFAFSSLTPNKNIPRLIESWAKIKGRAEYQLVIAGHQPAKEPSLPTLAKNLGLTGQEIIFTGYLPDKEIALLLSNASLFVFPSLYEGFGLPTLEAMAAGTPVACSSYGSLPEVAGEAAVFFDPLNVEEMAEVLYSVMQDEAQQQRLRERGQQNLRRFSWRKAARNTLESYKRAVRTKPTKILKQHVLPSKKYNESSKF